MKKILYPIFFTLVALLSTSCDNEPLEGDFGDPNADTTPNSNFQASIDGALFTAEASQAVSQAGMTVVTGSTSNGQTINITFSGSETGTFSLGDAPDTGIYIAPGSTNPFSTTVDATGQVTISDYNVTDGLISGTFTFSAERTVTGENGEDETQNAQITEGIFNNVVLESDENPDGPDVPDALFEVELDGELYTGDILANLNDDGLGVNVTSGVEVFAFIIYDPVVGSFDLGPDDEALLVYDVDNTDDESSAYSAVSGTINITSIDYNNNLVTGNFEGTIEDVLTGDTIEMTNGIFENISFQAEAPIDNASALVDGEEFVANTFADGFVVGDDDITLNFLSDLDERILITIPLEPTVGVFSISEIAPYTASYKVNAEDDTLPSFEAVAGSGEIEILSFENGVVSGTFNFNGLADDGSGDTVEITNGVFTYNLN